MLALGLVAAASPVALMYLLVNLYAAGVSVYFGGDVGQARLREGFLQPFADFMARGGGLPTLYAALTAGAASALTRASGAANTVQGVLLGLVSAVGIQLIGRAFGPFAAWELVLYPLLGASAGWLGVALSRGALERQEALYRATAALYAVDAPRDVAVALGENLAGPEGEHVTLWKILPGGEDDGGLGLEPLGSWAPPGTRAWPWGAPAGRGEAPRARGPAAPLARGRARGGPAAPRARRVAGGGGCVPRCWCP